MSSRFRSLRLRIQVWHGLVLAVVIVAFGLSMILYARSTMYRRIDDELASAVEVLTGQLRAASPFVLQEMISSTNQRHEISSELRKLNAELRVPATFAPRRYRHDFEQPYYVIKGADGEDLRTSAAFVDVPALPPMSGDGGTRFRQYRGFREAYAAGPPGTWIVVGRMIEPDQRDLQEFGLLLLAAGAVVFSGGLAGGWMLSQKAVRPIDQISEVAAAMSQKRLSDRIDVSEMDSEFEQLATTLNDAFARLESAFVRQIQFTGDASHELRTPLAVMKMHLDMVMSGERTVDEYRDVITTCQRAVDRMAALVDSLLSLARMDAGTGDLSRQAAPLNKVISECLNDLQPLADASGVLIERDLTECTAVIDRQQIGQLVTNLVMNALAHCSSGATVTVSTVPQDDLVRLTVADTGEGIAAEHLPHIFDRFYRVDKSRTRTTGGSGLGLSICQAIAAAHGGRIIVESKLDEGTTVSVELPCQQPTQAGRSL